MTLIHLCLIVCMFEPVCLCARMFGGNGHLVMPAASGGAPMIWDGSNINVSGAPPRVFKYQTRPHYALLGCWCESNYTTSLPYT